MLKSDNIKDLLQALCLVQSKLKDPEKKTDSGLDYKTVPLDEFFDIFRKKFTKEGLCFMQNVTSDLQKAAPTVSVSTFIGHKSGQWIETEPYTVDFAEDEIGLATYLAKKASFIAAIGITGKHEEILPPVADNTRPAFSITERRELKERMLDMLGKIRSNSDIDVFLSVYQSDIDFLSDQDPTYVTDILRELRVLRDKYQPKKENELNGNI